MIGVVDYGSGNVRAIEELYGRNWVDCRLIQDPADLETVDRLVLPGVGAFDSTMSRLERSGMRSALDEWVLERERPILGICVGMQLFATGSDEGALPGLNWIPGRVRKFESPPDGADLPLPHMGWNSVKPQASPELFEGVDCKRGFYFLHSYHYEADDPSAVVATTDYGGRFNSAVRRKNVIGVQFHPEKSHASGVAVLLNFARAAF